MNKAYKIPVLYRSEGEGIKYRLSEILFPRDPKVKEANLRFNREQMKNKLMLLGNDTCREVKKKLEDSLPNREKTQLKVIKESSMRMLLKDFLYFKSDLSTKQSERLIKEVKNDHRVRQVYYRNVKDIKAMLKYQAEAKQIEIRKRKDQEKEQKVCIT